MKYTKKEIKTFYGSKINKYADQEYWKHKKNIALHKQSRSENTFHDDQYQQALEEMEQDGHLIDYRDYDLCRVKRYEVYVAEITAEFMDWIKTHAQEV